ncbi:alginate lyase family protein [archaeon]|jgi:hypothetical protein|nr:alginate lyase family protein [archaeon]MBT4416982.1 alginate lyase family protein [archaeon]
MNKYTYEIKKSPKATPIKAYRFFRKKVVLNIKSQYIKFKPIKVSDQDFYKLNNVKTKKQLMRKINQKFLFINTIKLRDKELIEKANNILKKQYTYLGKTYKLKTINWHQDFNSKKVWPLEHFSTMQYENLKDNSDIKIVWDFNRFHHFPILGIAYQQTKNKKYVKEFQEQVINWIKNNPVEFGPNWLTPMEVSIRAINWIYAYHLFKDCTDIDERFWKEYFKQLYYKGKYIRNNLEWSPKKENHYISDIVGLFFIGTTFKNTDFGKKWIIFARKELEKEITKQVSEDGVDYEASINYHRLVTELFMLTYLLAQKNKIKLSENYTKRLENMLEFIMYYTKPNGQASRIGDTDNGRVIDLWTEDINDHRELLSIGAVLFSRRDFKHHSKDNKTLPWIMGYDTYKKYKTMKKEKKELQSKTFKHYHIMRDKDFFLMIHCGDIGRAGFGGHGHCDQLSFELYYKKDIVIDPGTFCYTSNVRQRHLFRSSAYHNTVKVNGTEMDEIEIGKPFSMLWKSKAKCIKWETGEKDVFVGKHQGFDPHTHLRRIIYDKKRKEVLITDKVTKFPKRLEINFHIDNKDFKKAITSSVKLKPIKGWKSDSYGVRKPSTILQAKTGEIEITTIINLQKA